MNKTKGFTKYKKMRYMPGLDGLRAIAVLGIIIYHLNKQWLTGGFLGVDTFFVISGYLITSLLLKEYDDTGIIKLKSFWIRRLKRLLPAVIVLLMVVGTATLLLKSDNIIRVKHDIIAAIFYVSNWWYIAKDVNYFEQFSFMPLKHLWSLAIEEQFYIFFPVILVTLLLTIKKRYKIGFIFWGVSMISLGLMMFIYSINGDHSRVYFGTDTRLQTLLLGVILAFLWPPFKLKNDPPKVVKYVIDSIGSLSFIVLILLFFIINDETNWIYDGGFYLISILTLFIIASVVHPSTWIAKIFSNPVLVFIGKRSYSLYLWHFAVISFVHSYYVDGQIPVYVYFIDISLTIIFAELSYRFIETPFRKEGIKALNWRPSYIPQFIRMAIVVTLLIPFMLILVGAFNKYGKDIIGEKANSFDTTIEDNYLMRIAPIDNIHIDGLVSEKKKESSDVYNNIKPLLIGDSVMVDIGESFKSSVPKSRIDGKVRRQLYQTLPLVKANYSQYKKSSDQVVLELGTNGDFTVKQLDDLLNQFGKAKIYLVNTRVPRIYEANVNRLLADAAKRKSNVTLIDWYKRSQGHSEYFAPDGVHLEYKGVLALKDEILKALKKK
ncbi:acyltransferase family protein [Staphylococcus aureus]|uniref:acyltransferase family protein n=1 Tax=Staphylococcus aureus TaxID=1280 RepID=UPI0028FFE90D|nr:acyltransferase family protein [Staphylococcus aureus]MDU0634418.1 acyltransferase family protein [Staphylococcus aureus]MDU9344076.1 acyltransferase family protein [Staphylococcus aureus]MDU9347732.1 acyltransferase family protein [Staphylococcus aureus]MDU9359257.1 acyltransferase family protein [Staphylococcus aureus]MDU9369915.1 acyltransferase family protein [Staphylococcus aureus]